MSGESGKYFQLRTDDEDQQRIVRLAPYHKNRSDVIRRALRWYEREFFIAQHTLPQVLERMQTTGPADGDEEQLAQLIMLLPPAVVAAAVVAAYVNAHAPTPDEQAQQADQEKSATQELR